MSFSPSTANRHRRCLHSSMHGQHHLPEGDRGPRGKTPETFYRTGYKIDVYGEMVLVCVYSNYLNQKPLQIPGDDGAYAYDQFASFAGTFDNGVISWGGNMIFYADPSLIGAYQMDDWRIQLASAGDILRFARSKMNFII